MSKSIFRKWWFWAIVGVILIAFWNQLIGIWQSLMAKFMPGTGANSGASSSSQDSPDNSAGDTGS